MNENLESKISGNTIRSIARVAVIYPLIGLGLGNIIQYAKNVFQKPEKSSYVREGFISPLREIYLGDFGETLSDVGGKTCIEYADAEGVYSAMMPSMNIEMKSRDILWQLPTSQRREGLKQMDADKNGIISEEELKTYVLTKQ